MITYWPDRVVDDLNPVLNFTRKEVESLLHFVEEEPNFSQAELVPSEDFETVIKQACLLYPHLLTKVITLSTPVWKCYQSTKFWIMLFESLAHEYWLGHVDIDT